jgi:hypothetical protein
VGRWPDAAPCTPSSSSPSHISFEHYIESGIDERQAENRAPEGDAWIEAVGALTDAGTASGLATVQRMHGYVS